jgi:hypothetical protein
LARGAVVDLSEPVERIVAVGIGQGREARDRLLEGLPPAEAVVGVGALDEGRRPVFVTEPLQAVVGVPGEGLGDAVRVAQLGQPAAGIVGEPKGVEVGRPEADETACRGMVTTDWVSC